MPGAGRLAALATMSAVATLVALVSVGGASGKVDLGGLANGSRSLTAGPLGFAALSARGHADSAGEPLRGASRSSVPSPGKDGELFGVICVTAQDCWAVGDYENRSGAFLNEALRWNGKGWSVTKTPDPGGKGSNDFNELERVRCVSSSDCWAVGETEKSGAAEFNQALHFNGKKWSEVRTPNPGGTSAPDDLSELTGVACVKAPDCWAVGVSERRRAAVLSEALHFNGKRWSVVRTPDPGGKEPDNFSDLEGLGCVGASDCWAVGVTEKSGARELNEALHFNGNGWSVVRTPDPAGKGSDDDNLLYRVSCVSASDCWAVGEAETSSVDDNVVLHWDGKRWSHVLTPQPSTVHSASPSPLVSVSCTSPSGCWAVGYYVNNAMTAFFSDAMHWNGEKWSRVLTPQPGGNRGVDALYGVTCVGASDCWAVGAAGPSLDALSNEALHWNGKRWSRG